MSESSLQLEQLETRRRLLTAAGEVFAERGFRDATVRDICRRAGANVASVNYHFRDKESLYLAVLQAAHADAETVYAMPPGALGGSAEERLRGFIDVMVRRIFDAGKPAWHGKLMAREMIEPTAALEHLVQQTIRPKKDLLMGIVREMLGDDVAGRAVDEQVVGACARSVIAQIVFHYHNRPVIERLFPDMRYDAAGLGALARHIADFSVAGIQGVAGVRASAGGRGA